MDSTRRLLCALTLLFGLIAGPVAAMPGDVAPAGAPDGVLSVGDVLGLLRMSVGLEDYAEEGETAPFTVFGAHSMVMPDESIAVDDVLSVLRATVGLHDLAMAGDATMPLGEHLDQVMQDLDTMMTLLEFQGEVGHGLWMDGMMEGTEDCPDGGEMAHGSGMMDSGSGSEGDHDMEFDSCDAGPCTLDGNVDMSGPDEDGFLHYMVDLHVLHEEDGAMMVQGEHEYRANVEGAPGQMGSMMRGLLTMTGDGQGDRPYEFFFDLFNPDDGGPVVGECYWFSRGGPAIALTLDGDSLVGVTVLQSGGFTEHDYDLDTTELVPRP